MTPQPWARTGPGAATDGKPKFDLERFDQAFFDKLRERVVAAGNRGIYVGVMFFDGWALHLSPAPNHIEGHPFHAANNANGISITSIVDHQVLPLDPRVQARQEAYIRKVIDSVHDLPNVLWEVANESSGGGRVDAGFAEALGQSGSPEWGDSTEWQYWVIEVVKRYEQEMGYTTHPIGMTMQFPAPEQTKVNDPVFASRADWISPGYDDEIFAGGGHPMMPGSPQSRWLEDPPVADGRKVVITDTDHFAPGRGDALWAWKSFLRGHHPILMDFGMIGGVNRLTRRRARQCPSMHWSPLATRWATRCGSPDRWSSSRWSPGGSQLDRVRTGEPGQGVSLSRVERGGRTVHRDVGRRHLRGRVVQRSRPRDRQGRRGAGRELKHNQLQRSVRRGRSCRVVPEEGRTLTVQ